MHIMEDEFESESKDESNSTEQIFHNNVREQIIFLLLFLGLYLASAAILSHFKRKGKDDYYSGDEDEVAVYRISTWLCTFSLAVSIGSLLLLPISIISNEVLVNYPDCYYIKWLNSSLIQGFWNCVFLLSNLSMFVLLPFAYLFTESEGFFGHRKGLWARTYETFVVLALFATVVLGITYVLSALFSKDPTTRMIPFFNLWIYLPFLYSCISFLGALVLLGTHNPNDLYQLLINCIFFLTPLVCTPLGFVRLFDVVGKFLIKPQILLDLNEEYSACAIEEEWLVRKLKQVEYYGNWYSYPAALSNGNAPILYDEPKLSETGIRMRNGELQGSLSEKLRDVEKKRKILDKQRKASSFIRNIVYPLAILILIGLTGIAVLLVIQNTLSLLIGIKALPSSSKQFTLGVSSLSKLGPFGAALEIVIIVYFIATSSIGLYTTPFMQRIRPTPKKTSFTIVIANCALLLMISSALPLLSKTLGITNFDLLGDFGSVEWLGNFKIVLLYNVLFAIAASLCIVNKFTAKVRRELYARLLENYVYINNCASFLN